jgi:thiamine-phosphate pyrophosphorylase
LSEDDPACGLYVVVEASQSAAERLAAALNAAPVACVLIEAAAAEALTAAAARPLIEIAQARDAAALIAADARLARTLKADGVHLPWSKRLLEAYEEARELLGERSIVGIHAGKSRHDAMLAAERGADYIGFGAPPEVKDREAARRRRIELVAWWAEIFTIPCVAFDVEVPEDAEALAAAGADFVGCTLNGGSAPADAADHIAAVSRALRRAARAA